MSAVVFAIKPSVHAAYQGREAEVGASVVSVYNKLKGVEPQTSAELVRYSAQGLSRSSTNSRVVERRGYQAIGSRYWMATVWRPPSTG